MKFSVLNQSTDSYGEKVTYNKSCSTQNDCGLYQRCTVENICRCEPHYEFNDYFNTCTDCPGLGQYCTDCCYNGLSCVSNICTCVPDNDYFNMCHPQSGVFVTASQIALSAALVMGIAALAMVIYRLCTKPRYLSTRHERASQGLSELPVARNSNYLRASLTSIQVRVLSRLRDRPPPYASHTTARTVSQNVERRQSAESLPEAPPPYEGQRETGTYLPPPYTEVIITPTGFLNPTYADTELPETINRIGENLSGKVSKDEAAK